MSSYRDFIVSRSTCASENLVKSEAYGVKRHELNEILYKFEAMLSDEAKKMYLVVEDLQREISCMTSEACYLQGFQDMVKLMADRPLD